jgi:hypothetical protein
VIADNNIDIANEGQSGDVGIIRADRRARARSVDERASSDDISAVMSSSVKYLVLVVVPLLFGDFP